MADNYSFKDAGGNTVTHASEEISAGVHASKHVPVDDAGVAIAKVEDAAHSSGDKGYMLLAVRKDTAAALAGADGDYIPLIVDENGLLHVRATNLVGVTAAGQAAMAASLPVALASDDDLQSKLGAVTETAPGTDTASSGLNGRLQRVAQRLTSLIALLPASLGQKAAAASVAVTLASDTDGVNADNTAFTPSASPVWRGLAGLYQATITELTAGRTGLARLTQRRGVIVGGDYQGILANASAISASNGGAVDITYLRHASFVGGAYSALDTALFNGADAGMDTTPIWIKIPLHSNWQDCVVQVNQSLSMNVTLALYINISGSGDTAAIYLLDTVVLATGTIMAFASRAMGASGTAGWREVPAMAVPAYALYLKVTPASDPSSGNWALYVSRG